MAGGHVASAVIHVGHYDDRNDVAEREIALKDQIAAAAGAGDSEKIEKLEEELVRERRKLQAELEEKKDQVRKPKG